MKYLTQIDDIAAQIAKFAAAEILWLDTEVADWQIKQPRLSLIQVLADPQNPTKESAYILDVLNQPDLVAQFVQQIMANPKITKVFHNAAYDLGYLGKNQAQNVICTLKLARKIGKEALQVSNLKLKTLAAELCWFPDVSSEEQSSDWGRRSLTPQQLHYAAMDVVYLAQVHQQLLQRLNPSIPAMVSPEPRSLTPTKVRIALECPRLFYLHQKFDRKALFVPGDAVGKVGNAFHQLAAQFIQLARLDPDLQALFEPIPEQLQAAEIATQMQQQFFKQVFSPYLQQAIQQDENRAPSLLRVWQGLQSLIRQFAELLVLNRHHCNAKALIRNTFIETDQRLTHSFALPNKTQQQVTGEFDCLIYDFQRKRLAVVEFKTYQPVDPSAQLAQVALYSYMLWTQRNVPIDSIVYCVLPEFKEYHYAWEQLENTVHQLIPHKLQQMQTWLSWHPPDLNPPPPTPQAYLCDICPQQQQCQTFFIPDSPEVKSTSTTVFENVENHLVNAEANFTETIVEPIDTTAEITATDAIAAQLVQTLQAFKIDVTYHGSTAAPAFIRVKLKPSLGIKVSSILKCSSDLQVQLGLSEPPLIAPQAGYVSVDLPRPDRQTAYFDRYLQPVILPDTAAIKIAIGVNIEGQLIEADLSDPNTCHFLVGGTTGSGKSEFLRSILLSLLVRYSPNQLKIALVDPKRVTFPEFETMPWLYQPVVKDSDRAIELMAELVAEMELRYQEFELSRCNDLTRYNQQHPEAKLPRIVCIFDEYADFMSEKEIAKNLEFSIKRLGAMARAAGIHLIIATQRPEAKIVTPIIRSNLPARIALKTGSEADSMIVLGGKQTEAKYLLGQGDLLYQSGANLLRLQSLFAPKIHLPD